MYIKSLEVIKLYNKHSNYIIPIGGKHVSTSSEKTEIGERNKEKELIKVTERLIQEFGSQISNDNDLLVDPDRLMGKFQIIEENIIKIMDKKHIREFEKEKTDLENQLEIQVSINQSNLYLT